MFYITMRKICPQIYGTCILISLHLSNGNIKNILFDCGLTDTKPKEQKLIKKELSNLKLEAIFISHCHSDHINSLSYINLTELTNFIYMSNTSSELLKTDSMKYYTNHNIDTKIKTAHCNKEILLDKNISFYFFKNGHIPGSISILFKFKDNNESIYTFFTGDYLPKSNFFYVPKLPNFCKNINVHIISECTNSTNFIKKRNTTLLPIIQQGLNLQKQIIIETKSLGQCQELLFLLHQYQLNNEIPDSIPINLYGNATKEYTLFYLNKNYGEFPETKFFLPSNLFFYDRFKTNFLNEEQKIIILPRNFFNPLENIDKNILYISTNIIKSFYPYYQYFLNTPKDLNTKNLAITCSIDFYSHANMQDLFKLYSNFSNIISISLYHGKDDIKKTFKEEILKAGITNNVENLENATTYIHLTPNSFEVKPFTP